MTSFEITHRERAGWQRRAARELIAILDAHRELPVIAWTVASAGATVLGHVSGPAPAGQIRQVFHAWRTALTLAEGRQISTGAGSTYMRAAAHRNRVQVRLTATIHDEEPTGVVTP